MSKVPQAGAPTTLSGVSSPEQLQQLKNQLEEVRRGRSRVCWWTFLSPVDEPFSLIL